MNETPEDMQVDPFDIVFKNVLRLVDDGFLTREEVETLSKKAGIEPAEFWQWAAARRSVAAYKPGVIG